MAFELEWWKYRLATQRKNAEDILLCKTWAIHVKYWLWYSNSLEKTLVCHTEYYSIRLSYIILLLWYLFISLFRGDRVKFHSHILHNVRELEAQFLLHYASPFALDCLFQLYWLRGCLEACPFAHAVGKVGSVWCFLQVQAQGGRVSSGRCLCSCWYSPSSWAGTIVLVQTIAQTWFSPSPKPEKALILPIRTVFNKTTEWLQDVLFPLLNVHISLLGFFLFKKKKKQPGSVCSLLEELLNFS